ncbi:YfeK family protein [Oceaniserpentilla sp. 4NH20-0058]|uniref:DUF5329 domain-containing protein n=1 Tax=Oceaniserpentilla sp. 4NH20-0058 TaxID=3127660 RepID=UPI0031071A1A
MAHSYIRLTTCLILYLSCICHSHGNTTEIQHLLTFVKNTQCSYIRNGTQHTGKDAVEHIKKKYDYFADDIETTEDFIRLSATKSTISGKPYRVICDGKTTSSANWLLNELAAFRQSQGTTQSSFTDH